MPYCWYIFKSMSNKKKSRYKVIVLRLSYIFVWRQKKRLYFRLNVQVYTIPHNIFLSRKKHQKLDDMNSSSQTTGRGTTISGIEDDSSCCIIQIENPIYSPKRLKKSAGGQSCCIFRVPHTLFQANETAYKPKIVSIGPYHHCDGEVDKDHLQMIQEHKQRYLAFFLSKTNQKDVHMTHLREAVSVMEERIRGSYSEDLKFDREKLIDMMVLDGCFILTLLIVVSKKSTWRINYADDPIFTLRWILPTVRSDLLLLENQVPFFVFQDILKTSRLFPSSNLNEMIFAFFSYSIRRPKEFWEERKNLDASHLLDLIRKTFIPNQTQQTEEEIYNNIFCCSSENTCFSIESSYQKECSSGDTKFDWLS